MKVLADREEHKNSLNYIEKVVDDPAQFCIGKQRSCLQRVVDFQRSFTYCDQPEQILDLVYFILT